MNFLKIISIIIALLGGLFGLVSFDLISSRDAVALFVIALIFCIFFILLKSTFEEELEKKLKPIHWNLDLFRNALAEIQGFLKDRFKFFPLHPVKTKRVVEEQSPLEITDLGERLLEKSGGKKAIDEQYERLEKLIDEKHPKTAYDVQSEIPLILGDLRDEDFMSPIKDFVYQSSHFEEIDNLELADVQRAMAIYLRNKYLERHPELKVKTENNSLSKQ